MGGGPALDGSGWGQGQVVGPCESGNELPSPIKWGNFLTSWGAARFSRRTVLHSHCRCHNPFLIRNGKVGYRSSIPGRKNCCFSYPKRPARPWNQTIVIFSGYGGRDDRMWDWPLTSRSAEIKNGWSYTPTPPHSVIACIKTLPLRCENFCSARAFMCRKFHEEIWIMFLNLKLSK
jgi:hypothetical protein